MKVRCLHTLEEIEPYGQRMNAINLASSSPDPFSTFEFYRALIECGSVSCGGRAWLLTAFVGDELVGYVALKESHSRWAWRRVTTIGFLVEHDADRPHVVALPKHVAEVTRAFYAYLRGRPEWDLLELQQQDSSSTLYPLPQGETLRGCWVNEWPNMENHTIFIRWRTLPEYFRGLSKKFRAEIRRGVRKLSSAGDIAMLTSADPASTPALFELFCAVERRSWKSQVGLALSRDPLRKACLRRLLEPAQPLRIAIQILLLDGVPIAGLINGCFDAGSHRGLYALHIAFDARFAELSPGSALLLMGMRQAIEGGYAFFNLLSGFGYYKHRWLARAMPTRSAQIYRIGRLPFWRRACGDALRATRALILGRRDTDPPIFNPARRGLANGHDESWVPGAVTADELSQFRHWFSLAQRGQCELLQGADFTAAMPFAEPVIGNRTTSDQSTSETTVDRLLGATNRSERMTIPVTLINSPTNTPSGAPTTPSCVIPT